jgi:serine/threonine-protein kinase HipA
MSSKEIFVFIALGNENLLVGKLWHHFRKGRESASFEYDTHWLNHPEKFALEPALTLTEGTFHTHNDQALFGAIGDSAPDRWGRLLMRRAEVQRAKSHNEAARALSELDYLLGVNDKTRCGALRFSEKREGHFLNIHNKSAIPPLVYLSKLLAASEHLLNNAESKDDLKLLLAPGSSLGGARPKASILDQHNHLAIAKFPRQEDEFNIVLWEAVALTLAKNAGIKTPDWKIETILTTPVLIIKRFDRVVNTRIPFLSAMSMIGAKDNEQHSYLEINYAIAEYGAYPVKDMAALWRRIVFNILISNTDDHLRNHAFLYERNNGWYLSPIYDINPTPIEIKPRLLTTAIDFNDNAASLDTALSVANDFRLSNHTAKAIISEVFQAVTHWRMIAKNFNLNQSEIDRMSSAFEHEDFNKAKKM